jgi:hypothetical protein
MTTRKTPEYPDPLQKAMSDNPPRRAGALGPTWQRQLHARIMRAIRQSRTTDPGWDGRDPEEPPDRA